MKLHAFPVLLALLARQEETSALPSPLSMTIGYDAIESVSDWDVPTPVIPQDVEVAILQDETGSFYYHQQYLKIAAPAIYDAVVAKSPSATFGVAGFKDRGDDYVYSVKQNLTTDKNLFTSGVNKLVASGGGDWEEAQFDAIVCAAIGMEDKGSKYGPDIGWSDEAGKYRVLVLTTDARFHVPPKSYHDMSSTKKILKDEKITFIGLKTNPSVPELAILANATSGSVQPLSSHGSNVAEALLAGLQDLEVVVKPESSSCSDAGLSITFSPSEIKVRSGGTATFDKADISVIDPEVAGTIVSCTIQFLADGSILKDASIPLDVTVPLKVSASPQTATNDLCKESSHTVTAHVTSSGSNVPFVDVTFQVTGVNSIPEPIIIPTDSSGVASFSYNAAHPQLPKGLGDDTIKACRLEECIQVQKKWVDGLPPSCSCLPGPNPAGEVPTADNQDGFWTIVALDCIYNMDEMADAFELKDTFGNSFGKFPTNTNLKYTQNPGGKPSVKDGPGVVDYMIKAPGDLVVVATDPQGNMCEAICDVPPDNGPVLNDPTDVVAHAASGHADPDAKSIFIADYGHHFLRG